MTLTASASTSTSTRYVVAQLLNTWVVRDKELLRAKKRSVLSEFKTKEEAEQFARRMNELRP